MELTVATFNIRNGRAWDGLQSWPFRRRATAATIIALDADVIGLQEVFGFQRRFLARRLATDRWVGAGRLGDSSGEQCPVVIRTHAIEVVEDVTRWYGTTPDAPGSRLPGASFPRIATIVRCRSHDGAAFTIANTHLDEHVEGNRAASTSQLVEWLDTSAPTIVMGDFNAVDDDAIVMQPLQDADLRLVPVAGGTTHRFTGSTDGPRIDHIWVSDHWSVVAAEVVNHRVTRRLPSDHWPVRANLRLDGR